jgi:hypothetical protein
MSGIYCTMRRGEIESRHGLVFSERAPVHQYLALCVNQLIEAGKMWGGGVTVYVRKWSTFRGMCFCVCARVEHVASLWSL